MPALLAQPACAVFTTNDSSEVSERTVALRKNLRGCFKIRSEPLWPITTP